MRMKMGQGIMQRKDEAHCGIRAQPRVSYLRIFSIYPLIATPPVPMRSFPRPSPSWPFTGHAGHARLARDFAMEVAKQTRSGGGCPDLRHVTVFPHHPPEMSNLREVLCMCSYAPYGACFRTMLQEKIGKDFPAVSSVIGWSEG